MNKKELILKAKENYRWYTKNVNAASFPHNKKALDYACEIYNHALYSGYITEKEHKKLCLSLPFDLGLL